MDSLDLECVYDLLRLAALCKAKVTDTTLCPVVLNLSNIFLMSEMLKVLKTWAQMETLIIFIVKTF